LETKLKVSSPESNPECRSQQKNISDNYASSLLCTFNSKNETCNVMSTETDQPNATLISIALLAYINISEANVIVTAEVVRA
jgi:hypothetical protein